MKKFLIISSFLMIIMSFSMIGYKIVSANEKVDEIKEQLESQKEQEKYLSPYGYSLDNPNIVVNPYGDSPLSAIILFETPTPTKITVRIPSQNNFLENTYKEETKHIIPIYGLFPNQENKIEIITEQEKKIFFIKTENIQDNISWDGVSTSPNKLTLIKEQNKLYGIDDEHHIRWFYPKEVEIYPYLLNNGNLLLEINSDQRYSLIEIDLLGKIYKQIHLEHKVYDIKEVNDSLFLLSNNVIQLDWQTGHILNTYSLTNSYQKIKEIDQENIVLINENKKLILNRSTSSEEIQDIASKLTDSTIKLDYYSTNTNYKLINGITFQNQHKTATSKKNIFLINYKKIDKNYQKYHINIKKSQETIIVTGRFSSNDEVYLILDKFLDKRIYDIKSNTTIINQYGLSGKYSIYLKINNTIYKTNTYITI